MYAFKATSPSPLLPSLSPSYCSSHWSPGCPPRWVLQQIHADFLSSLGSTHRPLTSESSANIAPFLPLQVTEPTSCVFLSHELNTCSLWASLVAQTGKASACNVGDPGSIPGSGRSPGEGNGNPLQYSCLENSMDGGAWWATVHGVTKIQTFTFTVGKQYQRI